MWHINSITQDYSTVEISHKAFLHYNYHMFFQKDELSKFDFVSVKDFLLALVLMIVAALFSFISLPLWLSKALPHSSSFFNSHYFGIFIFFLSAALTLYIIYYFCCEKRKKSFKEGLFLYSVSKKFVFISLIIGIVMPALSLPIIFKFAPHEFYAMSMAQTKDGLVYLFTCALFAPIFEEVFYRGFVFPFFQSKLNSFWAIVITSLFFGFSHFMNVGNAYVLLSLFIFFGFILTLLRYLSNSLVPPIITHFVHNVVLISSFLFLSKF